MSIPRRLALALLVVLACKPDKPVAPGDKDGKGGTGTGATTDIAPITRVAEMLPPSTMIVWDMAGPDRIAEVIGRDALVKKFEPQYRKIADELVRETGRDFLDPKVLAEMGIDTKGRIGVAVVSMQPMGIVAFATLKDKGQFRRAAFEIAGRTNFELQSTPLGHAEILRGKQPGGPAIVIREPYVAFVMPGSRDEKKDQAFELATMDPHQSLAAVKGYRKATGGLAPSDAMFYLDGGALSRTVLAGMNDETPAADNPMREEIARARADKAPPERIKELEEQAKRIDEDNARWAKRRKGERELFEQLFGAIETSVWTGDAKPAAIVGQGTTTFAADSPMLLAMENATGSPPLARALDGQPLFMITGKANVEQVVKVVDLFAKAEEGMSWAEVSAEIAKETGIDPDKDLKSLVTGQVGFAITRDGDSELVMGDAKQIGAAVHIEVHDPKGAKDMLAKAAKLLDGNDGVKVRKAGDGWVADVPKWRKLYADVQGPHLVIATDSKLVGRIASGSAGTIAKQADSAALAAASMKDSAASVLFDPELSLLFFGIRRFEMAMPSSVESPEDAKVPKSRAWKAKERELVAVQKKLDKAEEARSKAELVAFRAVVRPWGSFGANARRDGNTVVVQGGWFARTDSLASALMQSLDAVRKLDERPENVDTSQLFQERMKLENELHEIRRADLEKFKARKAR